MPGTDRPANRCTNPSADALADGEPILAALSRKYGRSPEVMKAAQDDMMTIAKDLGLNGDEARNILECDTYADDVRQDEARYQSAGVSAVPAFIINDQYLISGAQDPETLVRALRDIAAGSAGIDAG